MTKKVEFIESYIKVDGSDYQWCDNHGELIRCGECIYQQGDKSDPRSLNCYLDGRDAPEHGFCWMGKRKGVEDGR